MENEIILKALGFIRDGKALDLGCGYGENAVFLAEKGFDVTAVDSNSLMIVDTLNLAKLEGVKVKAIRDDVRNFNFENYDLVLFLGVAHFLSENETLEVIRKIVKSTNAKGLNAISLFVRDESLIDKIKKVYSNWEIIYEMTSEVKGKKEYSVLFRNKDI